MVITDTVGFIRDLPKDLFAASARPSRSRPTPISCSTWSTRPTRASTKQIQTTEKLLAELSLSSITKLLVFNKIDLVAPPEAEALRRQHPDALFISATNRETTRALLNRIAELLAAPLGRERAGSGGRPASRPRSPSRSKTCRMHAGRYRESDHPRRDARQGSPASSPNPSAGLASFSFHVLPRCGPVVDRGATRLRLGGVGARSRRGRRQRFDPVSGVLCQALGFVGTLFFLAARLRQGAPAFACPRASTDERLAAAPGRRPGCRAPGAARHGLRASPRSSFRSRIRRVLPWTSSST